MNDDLFDLYQQLILDHNRAPRNFGQLQSPSHHAHGHNPLCGDTCEVQLQVHDETITDVKFSGSGCAISKASASLMTTQVKGKKLSEVTHTFDQFRALVTGEGQGEIDASALGKLQAFAGVREFPMRVKCATLAWHTLRAALDKTDEPITTE